MFVLRCTTYSVVALLLSACSGASDNLAEGISADDLYGFYGHLASYDCSIDNWHVQKGSVSFTIEGRPSGVIELVEETVIIDSDSKTVSLVGQVFMDFPEREGAWWITEFSAQGDETIGYRYYWKIFESPTRVENLNDIRAMERDFLPINDMGLKACELSEPTYPDA